MDLSNELDFFTTVDKTLYDKRYLYLSGPITSELAHKINRQILSLASQNDKDPIYIFINSPGGELYSGFGIYDMMQFIQAPVYSVVCGLAASAASLIALAPKKEHRFALPNAKFLIHQPLISGQIFGQASDIEIHAKDIINAKEKLNRLYAERCNQDFDVVVKATNRDNWLDPKEAIEFGLISKVISSISELK